MSKQPAAGPNPKVLPITIGALAIAVVLVILWLFSDNGTNSEPAANQEQSSTDGAVVDIVDPEDTQIDLTHIEQRSEHDPLAAGEVDAPVALVVFSDYQCPFCAAWSHDTLPVMMEYVAAGDLRIEWRDLNVYGPPSVQASKAAYAAGLQNKFWQFHEQLYVDGEIRSESELTEDAMLQIAEQLELDIEQFTNDMRSEETTDQLTANEKLGTDIGAYSTPAFVLAGEPMLGAQPTEVFVEAMDQALAAAQH